MVLVLLGPAFMASAPAPAGLAPALFRNEPYRVFFPLAFVLGAVGVSHWVLLAAGAGSYLGLFHAVTQMQSFMLAFAAGFLLTAVPKRTRTAPASWLEIGALVLLLPAVSIATLFERLDEGQLAYAATLVVIGQFALRRFLARSAGRRPPASFVLVPMGRVAGVAGAAMLLASTRAGAPGWTHSLGQALVLEGVFLCLALGIGGFFLALALHGEAAPDASPARTHAIAGYALAGAVTLAGLVVQDFGPTRLGLALRGAAAVAVLVATRAWRLPTRPGHNRLLLWTSAWTIPAGLFAAAALPEQRVACMHIMYVGGFGLLAFAVAAHVALGHAGLAGAQAGRPWAVVAFGFLFVVAMALRVMAAGISAEYFTWLGVAASVWLTGAIVWAGYLLPKMWTPPLSTESP